MSAPVEFLEPSQLATVLRTPERAQETAVIDVRDEDFVGGHIAGAVNIDSSQFNQEESLDRIIDGVCQGKQKVVLHCLFSQQRGPRCGMRLAERLRARGMEDPQVFVLRGGFKAFVRAYRHDADLVEDCDAAVWGA